MKRDDFLKHVAWTGTVSRGPCRVAAYSMLKRHWPRMVPFRSFKSAIATSALRAPKIWT